MGDPSAMISQQLDALVKAGTITTDQQTAVAAAITASMGGGSGGTPPGDAPSPGAQPSAGAQPPSGAQPADRGAMLTTALDALVKKGTITAAQETAIAAALTQSMPGAPGGATAAPAAGA
jgi:hypothetical protein